MWASEQTIAFVNFKMDFFKEISMSENFEAQKNQLIHDLRAVVHEAQALAQSKSRECKANTDEKIRHTAEKTEAYVQSHPMRALGISAGIGLLLGLLIKRH